MYLLCWLRVFFCSSAFSQVNVCSFKFLEHRTSVSVDSVSACGFALSLVRELLAGSGESSVTVGGVEVAFDVGSGCDGGNGGEAFDAGGGCEAAGGGVAFDAGGGCAAAGGGVAFDAGGGCEAAGGGG